MNNEYKEVVHSLIGDLLKTWERIAFQNEKLFLKHFTRINDAWILQSVSWNSESIKFVYILQNGQHIGDSSDIHQWYSFLEKFNND